MIPFLNDLLAFKKIDLSGCKAINMDCEKNLI